MSLLTGMTWLLQVVVPAVLVGRLILTSADDALEEFLEWTFAVVYAAAIGLAGLWLALPWYTPAVYLVLLLVLLPALVLRPRRRTERKAGRRVRRLVPRLAAVVGAGAVFLAAASGRRPVDGAVDLAFPLDGSTYLVAAAGSNLWLNPHLKTLDAERFPDFTGQSHAVDLVKVGRWGSRARVAPRDDSDYAIFGDTVHAPCTGRVWLAVDGDAADGLAGNHVVLDCDGVHVVLAHLDDGSVAVTQGESVRVGDPLGRVGNSGRSGEPHLHIHAQTPGDATAPLSGRPIPMTFEGRYLARNDRVRGSRWHTTSRSHRIAASGAGQLNSIDHMRNTTMKTTITAVATMIIVAGATQAQAQDRWAFEVRANGALPTENIGTDELDYFGLGFEATVGFQLLPHLGLYGGWDWLHFDPDGALGTPEADFEETGYVFGFRFEHPLRGESGRGLTGWVRAGGIVDHLEVEDDDGELLADSGHGLGWEAGAGLGIGVGGRWMLTPGVRYRSLSRDVEIDAVSIPMDMNYLAFEVGFRRSF